MRCKACDKILDDHEATKVDVHGSYTDMCRTCLSHSIAATLDLELSFDDTQEDIGNITESDLLTYQDEYDKIYLSITNDS